MALQRLDRRTLGKAKAPALLRLAKYTGVPVHDNCMCDRCHTQLIEVLVRKLDVQASWPPRLMERQW